MNNLENIKAGDEVAIIFRKDKAIELAKVDRVTKTQIIISDNKYRKKDGDGVGMCGPYGIWSMKSCIRPITPEIEEKLKIWVAFVPWEIWEIVGRDMSNIPWVNLRGFSCVDVEMYDSGDGDGVVFIGAHG